MVEVFRTNVNTQKQAKVLLERIQSALPCYRANFDLEDCDNILRVETAENTINMDRLVRLIRNEGFEIAVLPDEIRVSAGANREENQ